MMKKEADGFHCVSGANSTFIIHPSDFIISSQGTEARMRQKRMTKRSMVMFMLALTFLAWATQTLFHQWGFGAELAGEEKFVPSLTNSGMLEIKAEATIFGTD